MQKSIEELEREINERKFQIALKYYWGSSENQIDYSKSCDILEKLSNESNSSVESKYMYANCLYFGKGVIENKEKANNIYKEILQNEESVTDANSKYIYGKIYSLGLGVEENKSKANEYFKAGNDFFTENENEYNNYKLGLNYYYGRGTEKNYQKAVEALKQVTNISEAYTVIAEIYEKGGYGLEKDLGEATKYYKIAAENNNKIGLYKSAVFASQNNNFVEAVQYYNKVLKLGYEIGKVSYNLGLIYYNGANGIERNYVEALKSFKEAANNNILVANYYLGKIYYWGDGVERNVNLAYTYFEKANNIAAKTYIIEKDIAEDVEAYGNIDTLNERISSLNTNDIYFYEQTTKQELENAISRYQTIINAFNSNDDLSLYLKYKLASYIFLIDNKTKEFSSKVEALLWDLYNSNNNFFGKYLGTYSLGTLYSAGEYLEKDVARGIELLKESADMGNIEAIQELIDIFTNNGNEEESKKYIIKLNNLKVA